MRAGSLANDPGSTAAATGLLILAAICYGTVPFFAKSLTEAGISAPAIAFYRYAFTAVLLSPFLLFRGGLAATTGWGVFSGATVGIGWMGYIHALEEVPVSTVGVLYMTYPIFTLLIAWLFFGERASRRALMAAGIILAAAIVSTSPAVVAPDHVPLLLLSLLAPLGFGIAINILTNKLVLLPPLSRIASVAFGSTLGLLPLIALSGDGAVLPPSASAWWLIGGIALATALIPQLLYTTWAPRVGAARTAMAGSVELPTMFIIGWMAFGENLTALQLLAGAAIALAIVITPSRNVGASRSLRQPAA